MAVGVASPASAASTYGGAGTAVNLTIYNSTQTSFLPTPPSSIPTSAKITSITYDLNYSAPNLPPGSLTAYLCSTLSNCTEIHRPGTSTSFFNGLPASTQLQIRVQWYSPFLSGTISGGVAVTDSITVSYA